MTEIKGVYQEAAPQFIKCQKQIEELEMRIRKTNSRTDLTPSGKTERIMAIRDEIRSHKAEQERIAAQAKQKVQLMRTEAQKSFYASPADLDMNVILLVESGVMDYDELVTVVNGANDTTKLVVGAILAKSEDQKTRGAGLTYMQRSGGKDMALIDGLISVGNACLGDAPFTGAEGAENMFSRFDELTADGFTVAQELK